MSGPASVWLTPRPITRLRACVVSAVPTSNPTDPVQVQPGETSSPASKCRVGALGAWRADWDETPEMLRLASPQKCARPGDTPAPTSTPAAVWPLPSPQAALPVGSSTRSDTPTVGDAGVGEV